MAVLFEVVMFAIANKRIGVLPVLFFVGILLLKLDSNPIRELFLLPLTLRSLPGHGLIPYVAYLISPTTTLEIPYRV